MTIHPTLSPRTALLAGVLVVALPATAALGRSGATSDRTPSSYSYTCGHLGVPCVDDIVDDDVRVKVTPNRALRGRRTPFRVVVTRSTARGRRPVAAASVRFAGRRVRTDRSGRAVVVARFLAPGRRLAKVETAESRAQGWVRVIG